MSNILWMFVLPSGVSILKPEKVGSSQKKLRELPFVMMQIGNLYS
jgi:hypothetical protein